MMTQEQSIKEACRIIGLAFLVGPYEKIGGASDCFCENRTHRMPVLRYENDGTALAYVLEAVKEKMIRDGISPESIERYLTANPKE